jgi:bifunctional DNase/RNase
VLREVDGERFLPVVIGLLEAQAIAVKIQGMPTPRPLTHDLLAVILSELHGKLVRVTIDNVREGTFFATLEIDNEGRVFKIDSRPSDAIALAVRMSAPIFVSEAVMDAASSTPEAPSPATHNITDSSDLVGTSDLKPVDESSSNEPLAGTPVEELEAEMKSAIREENYERAAQLRDEIQRLRGQPHS